MRFLNFLVLYFLCSLVVFGQMNNTRYGTDALFINGGTANSAFGYSALCLNRGNYNSSLGYIALFNNTTGGWNSSLGSGALYNNTTGNNNTAVGEGSLYANTEGSNNSAFGEYTLRSNTASYNTAMGSRALYANTTGNYNAATGYYALGGNSQGNYNTANGCYALYSNKTGGYNTAMGYRSLYYSTTGYYNTANGYYALYYNTSDGNTANGYYALYYNTTGTQNTATGYYALRYNNEGCQNTATGNDALSKNTTGYYNTAVGTSALCYNTTGSYNTAVGFFTGSNTNDGNLTNITAIGYGARNTQSNEVRIGNTSVSRIGGQVGWSTWSDGRIKKNIRAEVPGLAFINLLQPVAYTLDMDAIDEYLTPYEQEINRLSENHSHEEIDEILKLKPRNPEIEDNIHNDEPVLLMQHSPEDIEKLAKARANMEKMVFSGFIAQDVEKAAKSIGYDFSGVDAPENDKKSLYGLRYAEFVVPLVKAVQELSEQVNEVKELREQNNKLQEQINELAAKLNELTNATNNQNSGVFNESEGAKNFSFSLFPNPTSGMVTVDYTMHVDAKICIEIYNTYGQRVKLLVPQQNKKTGTYSVQTSVADLGIGTYIVKVTSNNQFVNKQLVINK